MVHYVCVHYIEFVFKVMFLQIVHIMLQNTIDLNTSTNDSCYLYQITTLGGLRGFAVFSWRVQKTLFILALNKISPLGLSFVDGFVPFTLQWVRPLLSYSYGFKLWLLSSIATVNPLWLCLARKLVLIGLFVVKQSYSTTLHWKAIIHWLNAI